MQMAYEERKAKLFQEIAKFRYDVYCAERGYLNESDYEDGQETDHYDERSVHIVAKTLDGVGIGTARLVLGSKTVKFPFEQHCLVDPHFELPPHQQSAEVSRLIVKKNLRRIRGKPTPGTSKEARKKVGTISIDEQAKKTAEEAQRIGSEPITLELLRAMYRYSIRNDIRYWYAAMEKGLFRLLGRMGLHLVPIGPEGDYYGPVTSYVGDLRKLEETLRQSNEPTLGWFQDEAVSDWLLISTITNLNSSAHTPHCDGAVRPGFYEVV